MKHMILSLLAALGLCAPCAAQDTIQVLAPKAFLAAVQADTTACVLDVRRPAEYAEGHLAGAVNLDWLAPEAFTAGMERLDRKRTYYVYCRSGRRSHAAAMRLEQSGFRVFDMKGAFSFGKSKDCPSHINCKYR